MTTPAFPHSALTNVTTHVFMTDQLNTPSFAHAALANVTTHVVMTDQLNPFPSADADTIIQMVKRPGQAGKEFEQDSYRTSQLMTVLNPLNQNNH